MRDEMNEKLRARCDDLFSDVDAKLVKKIWSRIDNEVGVKQVLGIVPRGSSEPFWKDDPSAKSLEWSMEQSGDIWFHSNADLVLAVTERVRRGDELALHGFYHSNYQEMTREEQKTHIELGIKYLVNLFGIKPKYFMAPYNAFNEDTTNICRDKGLIILIPWASGDGAQDTKEVIEKLRWLVKNYGYQNPVPVSYHPHSMAQAKSLNSLIQILKIMAKL